MIVADDRIIGWGFNRPPKNRGTLPCRCGLTAPSIAHPKSDRTCCMHAEWVAILQALKWESIQGATLYFTRADIRGLPIPSGRPYCTVCSRLALEVGIGFWVLAHDDGIRVYTAIEYDEISHQEAP